MDPYLATFSFSFRQRLDGTQQRNGYLHAPKNPSVPNRCGPACEGSANRQGSASKNCRCKNQDYGSENRLTKALFFKGSKPDGNARIDA